MDGNAKEAVLVFSDSLSKAQRLVELQYLFWRNGRRPLTTRTIAQRLGVNPRTVRKYLTELSASGRLPVTRVGRGWRLPDDARMEILPVRFLLEEATAVYLAARLLCHAADEPNPAIAGALAKLAHVVPAELRSFVDHLAARTAKASDPVFAQVFRTLAYGWALSQVVELEYQPRSRLGAKVSCKFEVYLLEPAALGASMYAIGRAVPPGGLRTFKVERIRAAALTNDSFQRPAPDQLFARLDTAWGVWLSDDPPVTIRLRFAPAAAGRVRETRWHPSQRLTDTSDGGLEMTLTVTSAVELKPWILGWGSLCEVLEPADLRAEIAVDLVRAAAAYAPMTVTARET